LIEEYRGDTGAEFAYPPSIYLRFHSFDIVLKVDGLEKEKGKKKERKKKRFVRP
jgi:hypothetical protein